MNRRGEGSARYGVPLERRQTIAARTWVEGYKPPATTERRGWSRVVARTVEADVLECGHRVGTVAGRRYTVRRCKGCVPALEADT